MITFAETPPEFELRNEEVRPIFPENCPAGNGGRELRQRSASGIHFRRLRVSECREVGGPPITPAP